MAGPIWVTALAGPFLGERIGWRRWSAVLVGFAGVIIALQPSPSTLSLPSLVAISGSLFFALLMITTRTLRGTSDVSLVTWQTLAALIFGAIVAPFNWVPPTPRDLFLLALLGVVAALAHMCVNRSLKLQRRPSSCPTSTRRSPGQCFSGGSFSATSPLRRCSSARRSSLGRACTFSCASSDWPSRRARLRVHGELRGLQCQSAEAALFHCPASGSHRGCPPRGSSRHAPASATDPTAGPPHETRSRRSWIRHRPLAAP